MSAPPLRMLLPDETTIDEAMPQPAPLSFWQRPFIQNVLPLCTSIGLHAAVIVAGIATFHAIKRRAVPHQEQVNVPVMAVMNNQDSGDLLRAGGVDSLSRQDQTLDVKDPNGLSSIQGKDLSNALSGGPVGSGDTATDLSIGLTALHPGGGTGSAEGGIGDGPGGKGGNLMPFGVPGRMSGSGDKSIFHDRIPARRIVYVLDATGSMSTSFDGLRMQARAAIMNLRPPESFNIIFINDHNLPPFAPALVFVTPEAKRRAMEYIDGTAPRGGTDPLPALEKAYAQRPEIIYFLIDPSDFPDKKAVLDLVTARSAGGRVRLNVIGFEGHDPENESFLKSLAEKAGGTYRYVSEKELGTR